MCRSYTRLSEEQQANPDAVSPDVVLVLDSRIVTVGSRPGTPLRTNWIETCFDA